MSERKWTGGCLCGETRYEASGNELGSFICYCDMCQRASGSAFLALFYVAERNVQVTKGVVRSYRSSPGVQRDFCGECGSPLFFRRDNRTGERAIVAGSLDNPNYFKPTARIFLSKAVGWLEHLDSVTNFAEKPAGMAPPLNYSRITGRIDE